MDEKIPDDVIPSEAVHAAAPAAGEDVQQFSKWMADYGRPALIAVAVAVVVVLGLSVWRGQQAAKKAAAMEALFQNRGPEGLLELAVTDPDGPAAPLALASAGAEFYAQNRYDEALDAYQRFAARYTNHLFAADAALGAAASLEALDRLEEAAAGYEAFAAANPQSTQRPQAVFGAARCRQQLGQFETARALYEDFIAANPESPWLPQAESGLLFLKKAERAKDLPPPAVVEPAAPVAEAVAAPAAPEDAPAAVEIPAAAEVVPEAEAADGEPAAE